jgi:ribosomal protein S18 acetylase RimI-like enzyme
LASIHGADRRVKVQGVPLTIRAAEPSEFTAVGELCVSAYEGLLGDDHFYIEVLRDAASRAADAVLLVAVEDDELLGTVTFVPEGGPLQEIAEPDESEFRMLAVSPAAQGRGIGTALLQRVLDDSRAAGRRAVVCSSQPAMRAAHSIYERLGFTRLPERDWSPVPDVDLLAFGVRL